MRLLVAVPAFAAKTAAAAVADLSPQQMPAGSFAALLPPASWPLLHAAAAAAREHKYPSLHIAVDHFRPKCCLNSSCD